MSSTDLPISEDELHAYVDGRLDPSRQPAMIGYLRENPAEAERVAAYRAQRDLLRAAMAEQVSEAIPPRLNPVLIWHRVRMRRYLWAAAAAVLLAFGLGGSGGWLLRGTAAGDDTVRVALVREAVANHVVYTADRRRPTELGADQREDLARWVSNRLNTPVSPPDLSDYGYRFMGGRLAATPHGPAGMFMYQNDANIRLTVFVRPVGASSNEPLEVVAGTGPLDGCAWVEKGVGYTVVAPMSGAELHKISVQVQTIIDRRT